MGDNNELQINEKVPYIVYESAMARSDIRNRWLVKALVVAVVLLALTNFAWLFAWTRYDYTGTTTETTYTQDGEGLNIIGDSNDVTEQEDKDGNQDEGEKRWEK